MTRTARRLVWTAGWQGVGQASSGRPVEALYRERYQGFTVKHFHEHLVKDHGFGWGYTWTKLHLQWKGVVAKAPAQRSASQEARAPAAAGHDAAHRRQQTSLVW